MRRREFITLVGGIAAWPLAAGAQQPTKLARIGYLIPRSPLNPDPDLEGFRAGLRGLGYVEGKNIIIEYRSAEGNYDRLPELAAELVRLDVDVLVTYSVTGVLAAKQATMTIPIVMAVSAEAIRLGIIASLSHPGGNVTGQTFFLPELNVKRLEFLKEALPGSRRIGVLFNPNQGQSAPVLEAIEVAAKLLNLELQRFGARKPEEFASAFSAMATRRVEAVVVVEDPMIFGNVGSIVELATAQHLPSIGFLEIAKFGGLMGYGVDFSVMSRHAAVFVDKILKGAKPDELPVEQPTKFELVINLKTAKALGLTIPNVLFGRADEVIE